MSSASFKFDGNTVQGLEEIRAMLQLEDRVAVLRRAVTLLHVAATAESEGGQIVIVSKDGEHHPIELVDP